MDVGARIVELRTAYHVSQYALWKRSGVPQAAISQYESGKKAPEIDTLERICKGLGVTLADFFSENAPLPPGVTGEERALLESYRVFSSGTPWPSGPGERQKPGDIVSPEQTVRFARQMILARFAREKRFARLAKTKRLARKKKTNHKRAALRVCKSALIFYGVIVEAGRSHAGTHPSNLLK